MIRRNDVALGLLMLSLFLSVCSPQSSRAPEKSQFSASEQPEIINASSPPQSDRTPKQTPSPQVEVIATHLNIPWSLVFTDNGRVFLTERTRGFVSELVDGKLSEIQKLPIYANGEGGLLGLAASPEFATNSQLFVYYTTRTDNRVARFQPGKKADIILKGIPSAAIHNGGRLAFGPDGMLYIATGDSTNARLAQDPASLAGKILRISPDGSIPEDNPFPGSPVYALGFRNVQGLTWNARGELYATDLGPEIDDEINHVQPGKNYGWPEVVGKSGNKKFTNPVIVQQPRDASWSGATFFYNPNIPAWNGDLFVAALRGKRLWRFTFKDDGSITDEQYLLHNEYGRLRSLTQAPDGSLWILTSNRDGRGEPVAEDDRILRVTLSTQ